LVKISQSYSKK